MPTKKCEQLRELGRWAKESTDGSLADLSFRPINSVWDEVASDSDNCMGRICPTHGECFYYQARRRASRAQILIVNHALFFSDLALRRAGASILPNYDAVIFDEAHTVEGVAGDHLGLGIGSGAVEYTLNKLYNDRTNRGLLVHYKLGECPAGSGTLPRAGRRFLRRLESLARRTSDGATAAWPCPTSCRICLARPWSGWRDGPATERKIQRRQRKVRFQIGRRSSAGAGGEIETWIKHDLADSLCIGSNGSKSRRGQPRFMLCAAPIDVGPGTARATVRKSAQRDHDQRDAGRWEGSRIKVQGSVGTDYSPGSTGGSKPRTTGIRGRSLVRLLQIPHRPHAIGLPSAWAAHSIIAAQAELILLDGMPDPADKEHVRAGLRGNDPPLRGPHRRPGVRAVHQLRYAASRRRRTHAVAGTAQFGTAFARRSASPRPQSNVGAIQAKSAQRAVGRPTVSGKASTCRAMR